MDDMSRAGVEVLGTDACASLQEFRREMLEVVSDHHGGVSDYRRIGTLDAPKWSLLRQELYSAAPALEEFVAGLHKRMQEACAVFLPQVGFGDLRANERAKLAYALAACIGNPTATDKKQVVWDVKARDAGQNLSTYFSTFSETDGEAQYHTDTQYFSEPEPLFCLYVIEEARCHGGLSRALDARALRRDIEREQPDLANFLTTHALPFRVPTAFASEPNPDLVEATLAPIFDGSIIRYRKDTLKDGMKAFPEFKTWSADQSLELFEEAIKRCEYKAEFFMPRDSLLLMNNHQALHARTAFTDHDRHLLRIRMNTGLKATNPKKHKMLQTLQAPSDAVHA